MAYRILTLSGGGMRGVFQADYLRRVAGTLAPLRQHFDLIAGTSTGALVGLALALGIDLEKMVDLFRTKGPRIFPHRGRLARLYDYVRRGPRYDRRPLEAALRDVFGERRLGECRPAVVIATTKLDRFQHGVFTSLKNADGTESDDADRLVIDVALATSAAPIYFPSAKLKDDPRRYVDGGLWANNPVLVAVMHAHLRERVRFEDMRLVMVGNGETPEGRVGPDYDATRFHMLVETSVDMMFAAQTTAAQELAALLLRNPNVFSVNPVLTSPVPLDDAGAACTVLLPLAANMASADRPRLKEFLERPPRVNDLELIALSHTHCYRDADGNFSAEIVYEVRNASDIPVSDLFHDWASFFGSLAKPPDGPVTIDAQTVDSPGGPVSVTLPHVSATELVTPKFDGQERRLTRFFWNPVVTPPLDPLATLKYAVRVNARGTERAAFGPEGSWAGVRSLYPTHQMLFRCQAPDGYRFARRVIKPIVRTEEGATVHVPNLADPALEDDDRVLTWSITGGAVKTRVNYLVPVAFVQ